MPWFGPGFGWGRGRKRWCWIFGGPGLGWRWWLRFNYPSFWEIPPEVENLS